MLWRLSEYYELMRVQGALRSIALEVRRGACEREIVASQSSDSLPSDDTTSQSASGHNLLDAGMSRYSIVVYKQIAEARGVPLGGKTHVLADWHAGGGFLDWLDELVSQGDAVKLSGDADPRRYASRARVLLPLITENRIRPGTGAAWLLGRRLKEEWPMLPDLIGEINIRPANLMNCSPDTLLSIEAWFQSA